MKNALVTLLLAGAFRGATQRQFQPFDVPAGAFLQDPSFTPDGRVLFVTIVSGQARTIVYSTLDPDGWSAPQTVSFSSRWRDLEEVLSPDGSTIVFASNRPLDGSMRPIDAFYGGQVRPRRGGNLWEVTQRNGSWSTPVRLPNAVNANTSTFSPALTKDGTLYFMRASGPKATFHLFVAKSENGSYQRSAMAPFSDPKYADFDPTAAPDDSFVVFTSSRPPSKPGTTDIFISYRHGDQWTVPVDIGTLTDPDGDAYEPRLSPDTRTLYYTAGMPPELRSVELSHQ